MSRIRGPARPTPKPERVSKLAISSLSRPQKPAAPDAITEGTIDMPRPNRSQSPLKALRPPPVDSLGRLRVYFDLDLTMSTGLTMLAAKHYMTKRDYLEHLIREALRAEPNIAASIGVV